MSNATECVPSQIINQDEYNVGSDSRVGGETAKGRENSCEQEGGEPDEDGYSR